ncbi:MAG: hypothetical protein U0822_21440 [Anaerolineae bacterium]
MLRDDGVSYGDYVEQLTYLLFPKMDDEGVRELDKPSVIPADLNRQSLLARDGENLGIHYRHILTKLARGFGLIPVIFRKAQNKIQDPARLRRLMTLIAEDLEPASVERGTLPARSPAARQRWALGQR